jgi:hypothetical protein
MGISYDPPSRKWNVVPESIPELLLKQTIWVIMGNRCISYWVQQDKRRA